MAEENQSNVRLLGISISDIPGKNGIALTKRLDAVYDTWRLFDVRFAITHGDGSIDRITIMTDASELADEQIVAEAQAKLLRLGKLIAKG